MEEMTIPSMLVVGGSGFIGHHVVKRGVDQGWRVTSLGLNRPSPARSVDGAHYFVADLTNENTIREIGNNCFDYVVNLGGYIDHTLFGNGGRRTIYSHFDGLLNLIEFLDRSKIRRLIQIGSSDEYGDATAPQTESQREQPISPYSLGKVAATHFLQMLHRTEALPVVILRLYLTYGPGQGEQRFLPQIILNCLKNQEFQTSKGDQIRDFCYIDDTVDAIFQTLDCDAANGRVLNIASGQPSRIRDVVESIVSMIGAGKPQFGLIPYRPCENMLLYGDISSARNILRWAPATSLDVGLRATIDSIRSTNFHSETRELDGQ
jgi:nucleoside-diphosphate-sugar epimerase